MNKKIIIVFLVSLLLAGTSVIWMNLSDDGFWGLLAEQLIKEEESAENSAYGRIGRDTVCVLGDGKFQIGKFGDTKALIMYYEDGQLLETLLSGVKAYRKQGNRLYVIGSEGYGVADGDSNTCKLIITAEKQQITKYNSPEENRGITYLESYDLLEYGEKKIFETME